MLIRNVLRTVLIVLLVTVQLWFLYITFEFPVTGANVRENAEGQWVIAYFDERVGGFDQALQIGDIIVKINNKSPENHLALMKWRTLDQSDQLIILRDGLQLQLKKKNNTELIDYYTCIGELLCLFIAGFIWYKLKRSKSAQYLFYVFLIMGAVFASLQASIRGDTLGKWMLAITMLLLPVVFYHFLVLFFCEKGGLNISRKPLKPLYVLIVVIFIFNSLLFFPSTAHAFYQYKNIFINPVILFGFLLNVFTMTRLLFLHWRSRDSIGILVKSVWISILISFLPFALLSFLPLILYKHPWISTFYSSYFILFFPLSFTYLLATRQLYDIHIVLRRVLLTTAIATAPSLIITGFVCLISKQVSVQSAIPLFLFITALLSLVLYGLEYISTNLERVIFPRKYVLQSALKKIAKNLGTITSFQELKDIVLFDIVTTLQVHGGAIVFRYKEDLETISVGEIDPKEVKQLAKTGIQEHPSYLIYELITNEEYTCLLFTTRKKANTLLGREDVQWLSLIISYLSVAMENLYLIRKLTARLEHMAGQLPDEQVARDLAWFRKLMFEIQEKERMRIATDMHDTTMQDLFFLKRRLTQVLSRYASNEEEQEQIEGLLDYVDIINANLRQSCFELHPHLLQEIGLLQTVQKLVEQETVDCPFELEFSTTNADGIEAGNMETKRHLFRIVQELLNNAKKHSQATRVSIHVYLDSDRFYIHYEDDGVGFDPESNELQIGVSGIGMEQMRSRLLYLKGQLELETSKGNGVDLKLSIPVQGILIA